MKKILSRYFHKIENEVLVYLLKKGNKHIQWGKNIHLASRILLLAHKRSHVSIGNNVVFNNITKHNFVGLYKKCSLCIRENAKLQIGDYTGFSGISLYCSKEIIIGKYCNFGGNVMIWDTDFHPTEYQARRVHDISQIKSSPIIIGDDVFIGANSIILKGVTIGDRAVIGAGSLVSKNVPPDEIWAGNPARFIRNNSI